MLDKCYVKVNVSDNVVIAVKDFLEKKIVLDGQLYMLSYLPKKGNRIAAIDIAAGEKVTQYGFPFAISKGIAAGDLITAENTEFVKRSEYTEQDVKKIIGTNIVGKENVIQSKGFMGYRRDDGKVGTRNYYIIFPLSQCASQVALQIADCFEGEGNSKFDGVIPLPNTEGCGCTRNVQINRFLRIIAGYIAHPNVVKVLAVELGCEQTSATAVKEYMVKAGYERYLSRVDFISIQQLGGSRAAINRGKEIVQGNIIQFEKLKRSVCTLKDLVFATECGGSDVFSGITANRLIGMAADQVVDAGGIVILSEIPEVIGAELDLIQRCRDSEVARKIIKMVEWYEKCAQDMGESLSDNLVQENINGGLINPAIKSLGAIIKGGTRPVEDAIEYGEEIKKNGLNIMQGPGNDMESVTGMVASGANIVAFSTGKGTVTGSVIVPVIKVSSTQEVYLKMKNDMDVDGERLIRYDKKEIVKEFVEYVSDVASGKKTHAEKNKQRQFQVWTAGKLSV